MYMPKKVEDRGQTLLTPIFNLIYSDQPSMFLNLVITFSYNFIATILNSKVTFISSNLFQRLVLSTVSKYFLNSMKQYRRLVLLLRHSSVMILSVTRWFTVEWYLLIFLNLACHLALFPWLFSHGLFFFSKIILYSLVNHNDPIIRGNVSILILKIRNNEVFFSMV